MEFRQWVENRYRHPVVIVIASPSVEKSCRRNGMDFIHILRPFSVYPSELYAHIGDRTDAIPVRNFGVRLKRVQCIREVALIQMTSYFRRLLYEHIDMELAYGEQLDRSLSSLLTTKGGIIEGPRLSAQLASQLLERSYSSWYTQFIRDYTHLVRCSYFDTLDHPVGCIYAASTQEEGGIDGIIREFINQQKLPAETRRNMPCMDDDLHHYYILLHDITEGPTMEVVEDMFIAIQKQYGHANCYLIKINSIINPQDMKKNIDPSIWIEANMPSLDIPAWVDIQNAREKEKQQQQQQQQQQEKGEGITLVDSSMKDSCFNDKNNIDNSSFMDMTVNSINSDLKDDEDDNKDDVTPISLRFPHVHTRFGKWPNGMAKITGCYMSHENINDIRYLMKHYLSQCLFIFLERKLRSLIITINERRVTTFGKFTAWFKNKDEIKPRHECWIVFNDGSPTKYFAGSLEIQIRKAADLSFIFTNYELALYFYKMCRTELLSTLSTREFNKPLIAACQEGIGLCLLLLSRLSLPSLTPWITGGTGSKNIGNCKLEIAQNDYIICHVYTYAFRLSLLMYEYCRTQSPPVLDRAIGIIVYIQKFGIPLRYKLYSAILYELLATLLLFRNQPQCAGLTIPALIPNNFLLRSYIRQYTRYIIIAGDLYCKEKLFKNSLRCYLRALRVCGGVGRRGHWQLMFEHLHKSIAYIYNKLGNKVRGLAMSTFALSIGTPMYSNLRTGFYNFEILWNQQRQMLEKLGYALCPHMVIPCVISESIGVSLNVFHCDNETKLKLQVVSNKLAEIEWRKLEDKLYSYYSKTGDISPRQFLNWKQDYSHMQRKNIKGEMRRYFMYLAEPLEISVTLRNPIGGPIKAENFCLLYVSKDKPNQLWKSAVSQTIELQKGASKSVNILFSPGNIGIYIIIGFCWKVMGLMGYYYFATQAQVVNDTNSYGYGCAFEYAMEQPTPHLDSSENLEIEVGPPQAWITTKLDPELPPIMRNGEYYQTSLILTNKSSHCKARSITLQRSSTNAHIVWIGKFGLEENMDTNMTFLLEEELEPQSSITLPITVQAHHGLDISSRCRNNIFFLIGYIAEMSKEEGVATSCAMVSSTVCVRLHRFFRRVEVKPTILLSSKVLPPANATMATAVIITANNVSEPGDPPVRLSRLMAVYRPRWRVFSTHVGSLFGENALECIVSSDGALCIPLSVVSRAPSEVATDINTTNQVGLVEEMCIPITSAFPVPSKRTLVEENIGSSIVDSAMNLYFMRCSFRGPGTIGEVKIRDGLSFYLDKAGSAGTTSSPSGVLADGFLARQQEEEEQQQQQQQGYMTTSPVNPFTPICVAVAWVVVENGYTYSGQLFHFVDPVRFLRPEKLLVGEAHETLQEHLCDSMIKNNTLYPCHGAVFYHVEVPYSVESTVEQPDAVMIPVTLRCHSLAAQPLLVTVKTATPGGFHADRLSTSSVPFMFVGKTTCAFLLLPHENYAVRFTACAFAPGVVDCNVFELSAIALKLPLTKKGGETWRTGMSRGALLMALNHSAPVCGLDKNMTATMSTSRGVGKSRSGGQIGCIGDYSEVIEAAVRDDIHLIIIGHGVTAITRAVFLTFSADVLRAAAEATATQMEAYREDILLYETKYKEFMCRKGLPNASSINMDNNVSDDLAVYRPRARKLLTSRRGSNAMSPSKPVM